MAYTLLQLLDQVTGELGLSQPAVVIGSTNNQSVQMLALAQRLGKDLVRRYEWNRIVKAYVFNSTTATSTTGTLVSGSAIITAIPSTTSLAAGNVVTGTGIPAYAEILTVDSATQVTLTVPVTTSTASSTCVFAQQDYSLPADFDRMIPDSNWDRTNHWRNLGPKTSQEWQWLQGGVVATGPRERYRIYQNKMRIFTALTTPYTFAYEYVSNYWVVATGGTAATKAAFTVDTDTCVFPDDLMCAGLKLYFLQAKKLDCQAELLDFKEILSTCKAQDEPVGAKSLAPMPPEMLVGPWSIMDGNWPTTAVS